MTTSVFSAIRDYLGGFFSGAKSIVGTCLTALPYLFSVGEARKEVTEQYPDPISSRVPDDLPPRFRGILYNDIEKCTGCQDCKKACPTACITVDTEEGVDSSKLWVSVFDIDFSRCIFCGLCVEVCQPQSLIHTKQYEGAVYVAGDLVASFGRGYVTSEQKSKWQALRRQSENDGVLL